MDFLAWEALTEGRDPLTLEDVLHRPAFMADGACRDHPEVSFFPSRGEQLAPAKAVCRGCRVRAECLAFALAQPAWDDVGIWGGMSAQERKRLRGAA